MATSTSQPGAQPSVTPQTAMNTSRNTDEQASARSAQSNSETSAQRAQVARFGSRKRKQTSNVWTYFSRQRHEADKAIVVCQHDMCGQSFSALTSTTTLKNHLRRHGFFMDTNNIQKSQQRFQSDGPLSNRPPAPTSQRQLQYELEL